MQCNSWYRAGGTGKVFSNFPGPLVLFWWLTLAPRWSDYEVKGSRKDAWLKRRRMSSILRGLGLVVVIVGAPLVAQLTGMIDLAPLAHAGNGLKTLLV